MTARSAAFVLGEPAPGVLWGGVPGRQRATQSGRAADLDAAGAQRLGPAGQTEVPAGEGQRVRDGHDEVVAEAGVEVADLGRAFREQHPRSDVTAALLELEPDHQPAAGNPVVAQGVATPGEQHEAGIGVFGTDLGPVLGPDGDGLEYAGWRPARGASVR